MMAEIGLVTLWMAAALALLQAFWGLGALSPKMEGLLVPVKRVAMAQAVMTAAAFAALILVFIDTDLSVKLVATNSHFEKPMFYKIAATWGNHEGSMLLWVTVLSLSGALVALLERQLDARTLAATLGAQALIGLGFFAFLLFSSNPFDRLSPEQFAALNAPQGLGLNPLLQDPGLAFHPPTLYIGYVGLSVAFSFAVAALLTRSVGPAFARAMRPWVLLAWIFLTIGIVAGSYWAYYELGWGGWWFWDPVENASLMPWLAATALLHSVSVLAARDALRSWTIALALIGFAMSMIGTFLVRSGILTSVHAFAVDPERGGFILALMTLYTGAAFVLFALRIGTVKQGEGFNLFSREAALVGNNLLLTVILAVVFVGTLYPLFAELAFGAQLSVGPPYFNKASVPLMFLLMALLLVGPLLSWRRDGRGGLLKKVLPSIGVGVAATAAGFILAPEAGVYPILGLGFAAALAVASVMPLAGRNLRRTPLPIYGMVIAHLGIAVSVAGMAAERGFNQEKLIAMANGDTAEVAGWTVKLNDVAPRIGPNWSATEAAVTATRGGKVTALSPQSRHFTSPEMDTSEAALLTRWDGQLYVVLGANEAAKDGELGPRWQMRIWWKPFVPLIWFGGLMIALGGALALLGRWLLAWKKRGGDVEQEPEQEGSFA